MHTCFGEIDFQDSRKTQVLNYLGRIYYATKLTRRKNLHTKILTFSGMSDHPSIDCCNLNRPHVVQESWRSPIVNQKTLNRLRISLAPNKVLFLATSASGTWFSEINIFGVRYVLTYSPNHSSASGCKTLRSSMVYEVLKWHTKIAWMLCATSVRAMLINLITYLET